jgi:hypothetical protein
MTAKALLVALGTFVASYARVASADDCAEFLRFVNYDEISTMSQMSDFEKAQFYICKDEVKTYSQAQERTRSLGVGYDLLDLKYGETTASVNFGAWKKAFCQSGASEKSSSQQHQQVIRQVSQQVANMYKACVERTGLSVWITSDDEVGAEFVVNATYRGQGSSNSLRLRSFTVKNASCVPEPKTIKVLDPSAKTACSRDPKKAVTVVIQGVGAAGSASLKGTNIDPRVPALQEEVAQLKDERARLTEQSRKLQSELDVARAERQKVSDEAKATTEKLEKQLREYQRDIDAKGFGAARAAIHWVLCENAEAKKDFRRYIGDPKRRLNVFRALVAAQSHNRNASASIEAFGPQRTFRYIVLEGSNCMPWGDL